MASGTVYSPFSAAWCVPPKFAPLGTGRSGVLAWYWSGTSPVRSQQPYRCEHHVRAHDRRELQPRADGVAGRGLRPRDGEHPAAGCEQRAVLRGGLVPGAGPGIHAVDPERDGRAAQRLYRGERHGVERGRAGGRLVPGRRLPGQRADGHDQRRPAPYRRRQLRLQRRAGAAPGRSGAAAGLAEPAALVAGTAGGVDDLPGFTVQATAARTTAAAPPVAAGTRRRGRRQRSPAPVCQVVRPWRVSRSTITAASSTSAVHISWADADRPSSSRPL